MAPIIYAVSAKGFQEFDVLVIHHFSSSLIFQVGGHL